MELNDLRKVNVAGCLTVCLTYAKNMASVRFQQLSDFNLMIGHTPLLILSITGERVSVVLFCLF